MQFTDQHTQLSDTVTKFVANEINPYVEEWERAEGFPAHELFKKLGDLGLLGVKYPEAYGGLNPTLDVRTLCLAREILAARDGLADFSFAMQGLDDFDLAFRQYAGFDALDADGFGDDGGRAFIVAGDENGHDAARL